MLSQPPETSGYWSHKSELEYVTGPNSSNNSLADDVVASATIRHYKKGSKNNTVWPKVPKEIDRNWVCLRSEFGFLIESSARSRNYSMEVKIKRIPIQINHVRAGSREA